jgi:hypothetical protein
LFSDSASASFSAVAALAGNTCLLLRHIKSQSGRLPVIPETGSGFIVYIAIIFPEIPDVISLLKS